MNSVSQSVSYLCRYGAALAAKILSLSKNLLLIDYKIYLCQLLCPSYTTSPSWFGRKTHEELQIKIQIAKHWMSPHRINLLWMFKYRRILCSQMWEGNVTERNNIGSRSQKAYCHEEKTSERHFASWICANCAAAFHYVEGSFNIAPQVVSS